MTSLASRVNVGGVFAEDFRMRKQLRSLHLQVVIV